MNNIRPVLDAIDHLYAAVMTPAEWSSAVEGVADLLKADHAIVFDIGAVSGGFGFTCPRMDGTLAARICSPEAARLSSHLARALTPGHAISSASVISDRDMENSAFYNEFIRPVNGFYGAGALLDDPGLTATSVTFCRPRGAGPFDLAEVGLLQALLPHFNNVIALSRRLAAVEQQTHDLLQLLERMDTAAILVDAAALPCFANGRALRIVAQADGLRLGVSGLVAATHSATVQLRQAIADIGTHTATASAVEAGYKLRLQRPSRRPPLLLSLFPIGRLRATPSGIPAPRIAIFITEPDDCPPIDRDAVAEAFHLTPREADVTVLLAGGHDLASAAQALAMGIGTARYHLKNVLQKTNTRSQATLVAALRGFVGPRTR